MATSVHFLPPFDAELDDEDELAYGYAGRARKGDSQRERKSANGWLVCAVAFFVALSLSLVVALAIQLARHARAYVSHADCRLQPAQPHSNVSGVLSFLTSPKGTRVVGYVSGLTPYRHHGMHIHQYGDAPLLSGPIFDTDGAAPHGCLHSENRKAGDLGNLIADGNGDSNVDYINSKLFLSGDASVVGRSLIIKDNQDDCVSQPDGDSGGPYAFCAIEISGPTGLLSST